MILESITQISYLLGAALFIFSLRWLNRPETARKGVLAGVLGMAAAIFGTIITPEIVNYHWVALAAIAGILVGIPLSRVPLTAVPQRTAISHAFGGLAAGLVGTAKYIIWLEEDALTPIRVAVISIEIILGYLTFTGSLMAAGKLQEVIPTRPITYRGQNVVNFALLGIAIAAAVGLIIDPTAWHLFPIIIVLALVFGVMLIVPIGGADMPTVIALLNSYAGLAAVAMGFLLDNNLLIVAGALDGASGFILAVIMCKAMNRSFSNVMFGAFGQAPKAGTVTTEAKPVKSAQAFEVADFLGQGSRVVIVPGYGMAVAQAQHRVREIYDQLTARGVEVLFAIHPVAGRMPGHMNVLLAEAEIPYDALVEMDDINPEMSQMDVCLVVGANDVVNPAARTVESSPIYGMPIIEADKAKLVVAIKRSMNTGFAGIDNALYTADNTLMVFGDAKKVLDDIASAMRGSSGH
ncbi:MAG: NAD(P)(+) transhydrogenase (Re/Si-specific) subunit beta [Pseudomonadales bacterium]